MKKRLFASLLCLALCLGLLPGTAWANGDGGVAYIERGWDGSAVTEQPKTIDTYTTYYRATRSSEWNTTGAGMWPRAKSPSARMTTLSASPSPATCHLILTDGCTLTVNGGIQLEAGNSLTIYGQSEQAGTMGRLIASITSENTAIYNAAIGGNTGSNTGGTGSDTVCNDGGAVTIHGSFVSATVTVIDVSQSDPDTSQGNNNGSFAGDSYGAAIGGGGSETGTGGDGGTITIFGGTVRAESVLGAGIGGGSGGGGGGDGGTSHHLRRRRPGGKLLWRRYRRRL